MKIKELKSASALSDHNGTKLEIKILRTFPKQVKINHTS